MALLGLVMVSSSAVSHLMKWLVGLSDEAVNDPWFRRNDTSGLSLSIHWMKPGLLLLAASGTLAFLLHIFT
jgi:hypothetical protein